jgi:hypothetical protein
MFLLFTRMQFECGKLYDSDRRVRQPPVKLSAIVESLRNTVLEDGQSKKKKTI